MKFYYISGSFTSTKDQAAKLAIFEADNSYDDIEVSRVEVDTCRANILKLLNDGGGIMRVIQERVYVAKGKLVRSE